MSKKNKHLKKMNHPTNNSTKKKKIKPKQFFFKLVIYLIIASFVITGVLSGLSGMGLF